MNLDLENFSKVNLQRCDGPFNCKDQGPSYWALALNEEAGEFAGAVKKLIRRFNSREYKKMLRNWEKENAKKSAGEQIEPPSYEAMQEIWVEKKKKAMAKELADIFIYLDLTAQKLEIDLGKEVKEKFNEVSMEMDLGDEYIIK